MSINATDDTVVAVPEARSDGTFQHACADLVARIEGTFDALCNAFKRGPEALADVDRLTNELYAQETEYSSLTGNTHICK
jgi:hypothetical protein